jgi:hypothetical protein
MVCVRNTGHYREGMWGGRPRVRPLPQCQRSKTTEERDEGIPRAGQGPPYNANMIITFDAALDQGRFLAGYRKMLDGVQIGT